MIVFDLESRGLPAEQILAEAPPFNEAEVALGNRKKPEVIAEYIAEQKAKYERNLVERAALDATTATVLAIGILNLPTGEDWILHGEEKEILENFWAKYREFWSVKWIGFNSNRFDLPFLFRRCWFHGVTIPGEVYDGRYFDKKYVDLLNYWTFGNKEDRISLDRVAKFLGVGRKTASGAQFAEMWDTNREEAIDYLRNDLKLTAEVARRLMGGVPSVPKIDPDKERLAYLAARRIGLIDPKTEINVFTPGRPGHTPTGAEVEPLY